MYTAINLFLLSGVIRGSNDPQSLSCFEIWAGTPNCSATCHLVLYHAQCILRFALKSVSHRDPPITSWAHSYDDSSIWESCDCWLTTLNLSRIRKASPLELVTWIVVPSMGISTSMGTSCIFCMVAKNTIKKMVSCLHQPQRHHWELFLLTALEPTREFRFIADWIVHMLIPHKWPGSAVGYSVN